MGTVVPLGALKTEKSCGIGEYADIEAFADFCAAAKLKIIQLLPVNDTGTESSPYSALSAFALNPVYISIERLPEFKKSSKAAEKLSKLKAKFENLPRFAYREVRKEKLAVMREIYEENADAIVKNKEADKWFVTHMPWIAFYSVFMEFKRKHKDASWKEWAQKERDLEADEILRMWEDKQLRKDYLFYAWMQMRADEQFRKAADYAAAQGIMLKGDIPILMNEDSCDVWGYPDFFDASMRAGAPPDMYNESGQNWGFPVYNWKVLEEVDFWWWKERVAAASHFYKACRLDHILGFFRMYQMCERDFSAFLGHTAPCVPVTHKDLAGLGFSPARIRWLSEPHVPTQPCVDANNGDYQGTHGALSAGLDRIGNEELWLFKPQIAGELDILALSLPQGVTDVLLSYWHNRTLFKVGEEKGEDVFMPTWMHENTTSWNSLSEEEKTALTALFEKKNKRNEKIWEDRARTILSAITSNKMITCAEDLGVNFKAVPKLLAELSILSLRVVRWTRDYAKADAPYVPFKKYPELSVTTTSVHDSSTTRMWWENEREHQGFVAANKPPKELAADIASGAYTPAVAKWFLEAAASSASAFCIFPIQDFFAVSQAYRAQNAADERVNVPGTVNDFNWTYRLPVTIETLAADTDFVKDIASIAKKHA